jgi:hypothetical protein
LGRYPSRRGISYRVSRHYPAFIAHTGSCARPKRSCRLRLSLVRQVFAACRHSLRRVGPSRRYLCESFSGCLDPYPGGSSGALTRFFPEDIGLHQPGSGSALNDIRTATSVRRGFRGYSHSLMFRPPDLLATQIAPTAAFLFRNPRQPWLLRPRISRFVTSPSSGYASRSNRAISGVGTFTPLDSQPCRLLPQATPLRTCPALRLRWCPLGLPYRLQDARLPAQQNRRLSPAPYRVILSDHNNALFGALQRGLHARYTWLRTHLYRTCTQVRYRLGG